GGETRFEGNAEADDAFIVNDEGGTTHFHENAQSDNALIVNLSGGRTHYEGSAQGGTGTILNLTGGELDIDGANVTLGHVRGGGNIVLDNNGSLTLDSTDSDNP